MSRAANPIPQATDDASETDHRSGATGRRLPGVVFLHQNFRLWPRDSIFSKSLTQLDPAGIFVYLITASMVCRARALASPHIGIALRSR